MKQEEIIASFVKVISCEACVEYTSRKLLRDNKENIPQPGYVGKNYDSNRLLLVGQNPGIAPEHRLEKDKVYTQSLRELARKPSMESYKSFYNTVIDFVPEWPVNRNYFPLEECDLSLEDIAYCNVVRCRTVNNSAPSKGLISNCTKKHFLNFVNAIEPNVVIFIGKWAHDNTAHLLPKGVKYSFMNRMRSLSGLERQKNRREVIALVKAGVPKNT